MAINNFPILAPLIQFDKPGDCYFIQLLKRQKDNPDMTRNMVNVENFFVYSSMQYWDIEPKIIELCNLHNARAYIRVNRRNTENLALQTMVHVSNLILSKDYKSVKNAYLSVAGKNHSEPLKRWIVDIDHLEDSYSFEVTDAIKELHKECNRNSKQGEYKILLEVPTKNGSHIITNPFNLEKFRKIIRDEIDIHKDNPTILYMPDQKSDPKPFSPFSTKNVCEYCSETEEDGHANWCPEVNELS
jgi:hypothetical protein